MAAEHAADNQQTLEAQLGRNVTSTDLYLAHFLGVGGAAKFLRAHDQNPGASAAAVLPSAASANRWVFYDRNGAPRSEERRVGKEGVSTCRSRWSTYL